MARRQTVAELLEAISWRPGNASEASGIAARSWRRWKAVPESCPDEVYWWLVGLAAAHEERPFPQSGIDRMGTRIRALPPLDQELI